MYNHRRLPSHAPAAAHRARRPALITLLTLAVCGITTACVAGSDPEPPAVTHAGGVVPSLFFSDGHGAVVDDDTADDTAVYRALPGKPDIAPLVDPDGTPLTWGEARTARGKLKVICEEAGTRIEVDADALRPNAVYTAWLAFFREPGFVTAGTEALLAVAPVGPSDGGQSVFETDASGRGQLSSVTPAGQATVVYAEEVDMPACLLDTFEVHVVLAYHPDGNTCGDNPCADPDFVEHLAWIIQQGEPLGE